LQLAPSDSIVSVVDTKGRNMRYTLQFPLETPEANPENIIKKGNTSQEGLSTAVPGDSGNLQTWEECFYFLDQLIFPTSAIIT
jgi:hypothetical protein